MTNDAGFQPELKLVERSEDIALFTAWLTEHGPRPLAVDTETTGLDPRTDTIRLIQVGDADTAWAIPWGRWAGAALDVVEAWPGPIVMHNAKFDVAFIEHCAGIDVDWTRIQDTMVMARLSDPTGSAALKSISRRYVDRRAPMMQEALDQAMSNAGWTWATVPASFPPYWQYAALDTILTRRLYDALNPVMDRLELRRVYAVEMAALAVLYAMERRGAAIDLAFASETRERLATKCDDISKWCSEWHHVTPGSTAKVADRLVELGAPLSQLTPTGKLKLDNDVLETVIAETNDPVIEHLVHAVRAHRRTKKRVSTYFDHFLTEHVNGRVHGSIETLAARTGRQSIRRPPLQTLPRGTSDDPEAVLVRDCFIPSEGRKLVTVDYDQIELRIAAAYSGDPNMIEATTTGDVDPFTAFARRIYDDETIVKADDRRQMTKNATYAKLYGAGVAQFARTAGVSVDQAGVFLSAFDAALPGVRMLQRHVDKVARQRLENEGVGYVRTALGRRLVAEDDGLYKLLNYLIQASSADVLKRKIVELDLAGLADYAILPVHDEVVFDVPAEDVEDFKVEAVNVMSDDTYTIPLPVAAEGPFDRWGDKYR